MTKEVSYDRGLVRITEILAKVRARPYFLGVYGEHNTGKSHLIDEVSEFLYGQSIDFTAHSGDVSQKLIERLISDQKTSEHIHIFECNWQIGKIATERLPVHAGGLDFCLANVNDRGRGVDFAIGLYSVGHGLPLKQPQNYDLVIRNELACLKSAVGMSHEEIVRQTQEAGWRAGKKIR